MITAAAEGSLWGSISISRKHDAESYVYEQGDCVQSEADQYGISLSTYIHALFGLIYQRQCARILMIGCGGGTLATLLARIGAQVTVVDINPQAFELAHEFFHLPSDVRCVVSDGAQYLVNVSETFDAIVLDAYDGSVIPPHLTTSAFLQAVKRRLSGLEGIFLANVFVHHAFDLIADRMVESAYACWPVVRLLDSGRHTNRNAIVMAGNVADLKLPTLLIYPEGGWPEIAEELNRFSFRESRLAGLHEARCLGDECAIRSL